MSKIKTPMIPDSVAQDTLSKVFLVSETVILEKSNHEFILRVQCSSDFINMCYSSEEIQQLSHHRYTSNAKNSMTVTWD